MPSVKKGNRPTATPRRRAPRGNRPSSSCSLSFLIIYGMVGFLCLYVVAMLSVTRSFSKPDPNNADSSEYLRSKKNPNYVPHVYSREEWGNRNQPYDPKRGWGHDVAPQQILRNKEDHHDLEAADMAHDPKPLEETGQVGKKGAPERVLAAYLEPINPAIWETKPLPARQVTSNDLKKVTFEKLNSCSRLTEQFPADEYPDDDPFLPWIHDVFPSHDGKFIQFVAQNKRRCKTGSKAEEIAIRAHMAPQVALFQHVAVKRLDNTTKAPRYRLSTHEEADPDGMETRFICRFQPSGEETLSVYNFNYEYASYLKKQQVMFHEDGKDNKQVHTTQLVFQCPVPPSLVEKVRTGETVTDDYATLFVDLVPIRTPVRYMAPHAFLTPYYKEFQQQGSEAFDAKLEWGTEHILPKVEDSGRWENIPICKPSLLAYGKQTEDSQALATSKDVDSDGSAKPVKQHHLASCLWASSGYATRGNRFAINDGQRRLLEWITYNKLIGVDHFYLYDNSGAFSDDPENSLRGIADLFPDDVTVIKWPAKVCNNNPNNVDSVGERSSQYAAEASCRLRFGPHVKWIAQFDIDEYLVPMGNNTSVLPLLDKLDQEGNKIISFGSWRSWPRRRFIETPVRMHGAAKCGRNQDCFQLRIPMNYTMLQSYNCDRQKPGEKQEQMPAEKQIYRPDYVLHHFIHYSTVTANSILNRADMKKLGRKFDRHPFPDPMSRFGDEVSEALMLHTKAVATQDTVFWEKACKAGTDDKMTCRLGTPFLDDMTGVNVSQGDEGWKYNCYVNHKIEDYWVPRLEDDLKAHIPELASRIAAQN